MLVSVAETHIVSQEVPAVETDLLTHIATILSTIK